MDMRQTATELLKTIEAEKENYVGIAREIWKHPEVAFTEVTAAKLLTDCLKAHGFELEFPYAKMDTAFRAVYRRGTGGGTFAFAAEYDSLAGIGHACGHNTSGVASVCGAIATKKFMEDHDVSGTIIVLGTPGEEGGGGKVLMLRNANCLEGVDVVMMAHASGAISKADGGSTGIRRYDVEFFGKAAHAAGAPERGLNALDAQVLLYNAIGLYRQQMNRKGLIHGVIFEGGEAVNVIPDHTRSRFYIRSTEDKVVDEIYARFCDMVKGAALMTGTTYEIKEYSVAYRPRRPNTPLNNLYYEALEALDIPHGGEPAEGRGSSDFGDFSQVAPGIHPYFCINENFATATVPGHSEALKACANSDFGYAQMLKAGAVLGACALRVLTDAAFREEVKADFIARGRK